MKKKIGKILLCSLGIVSLLSSCRKAEAKVSATFEEILKRYQKENITFHTDLKFYYREEDSEDLNIIEQYDVVAKFTEDKFYFEAKIYGTDSVYSSFYLEKDENGNTVTKYIGLHNEIVTEEALNTSGKNLNWSNSLYTNTNLLNKVDVDQIYDNEDGTYTLSGSGCKELLANIGTVATNTSTFTEDLVDTGKFVVDENENLSLIINEAESDSVYEGYIYGRVMEINFIDVDNTTIGEITPYEEKAENESLKSALNKMGKADSLTYSINSYIDNNLVREEENTVITSSDIYSKSYSFDSDIFQYSGLHTLDGNIYSFSSKSSSEIIGYETTAKISDYFPTFDFSSALFSLKETDGSGNKHYTTMNYPEILNYVTISDDYASNYFNGDSEPVELVVDSDDNLIKIIVPCYVYIFEDDTQVAQYGKVEIIYSNINSSTTDGLFDGFRLENESDTITSFSDYRLSFVGADYANVGEAINGHLGSSDAIPFFLPSSIKSYSDVSYEGASEDYLGAITIYANEGVYATSEEYKAACNTLSNANYLEDAEANPLGTMYYKNFSSLNTRVEILISNSDGSFAIEIYFIEL